MEGGEISNFIKVWLTVILCLCYCYTIGKITPKGTPRLLPILPVVCLFLLLPLNLHTMHLGGFTAFLLPWLTNFKLLLFAFDKGPLPSLSLPHFIAVGCLPIKPQQTKPQKGSKSPLNYTVKALLIAVLVRVYSYGDYIHPKLILVLYGFHVYFTLEIVLATMAIMAKTLLNFEFERQFDEPYLATSLQDFWGRRWNIMVTTILRPTVYEPILHLCSRIMPRKWASLPAVMATFGVSAIMHELVFFYLGRVKPTWEITWFFILHGACLVVEIVIKKVINRRWRLHRMISGPLTIGFVLVTGFWLFFPQLLRCNFDVRGLQEYAALGAFVKDVGSAFTALTLNKL